MLVARSSDHVGVCSVFNDILTVLKGTVAGSKERDRKLSAKSQLLNRSVYVSSRRDVLNYVLLLEISCILTTNALDIVIGGTLSLS